MQNNTLYLGIDIGSTTIKFMLTDGEKELFSCYERHFSRVREKTVELLERAHGVAREAYPGSEPAICAAISGSAGMGLAEAAGMPFVQEVVRIIPTASFYVSTWNLFSHIDSLCIRALLLC